MPRYRNQTPLPDFEIALPSFERLEPGIPKVPQVANLLQRIIEEHRTEKNQTFYSTRDIARFFSISQNSASLALKQLETEGLVQRIRGSHTLLLGKKIVSRANIRAVAGLMLWVFSLRFSELHGELARLLGESLWARNIALEIIPHYDIGDARPDLNDSLRKHALDFTIWPFPFNHHREHFEHLKDRGVRSLVIGVHGAPGFAKAQIQVDFLTAYQEVLTYWREHHSIERVIVIEAREFTPRRRIHLFCKLAAKMGFDCQIEKSQYEIAQTLFDREKGKVGIALLDEHSMVEFSFYDPKGFTKAALKHRILFGQGTLNIPFVPDGKIRVERIFVPMDATHPSFTKPLIPAITNELTRWCRGDFETP
ncbi:MAG: hypothetical protein ACQKBT_00920, partial [Puniceicoccales bacterium]